MLFETHLFSLNLCLDSLYHSGPLGLHELLHIDQHTHVHT